MPNKQKILVSTITNKVRDTQYNIEIILGGQTIATYKAYRQGSSSDVHNWLLFDENSRNVPVNRALRSIQNAASVAGQHAATKFQGRRRKEG